MSNESSESKKHQATDVKLKKERDKGRIAKSADLYSATAALTGIVAISMLISYMVSHVSNIADAAVMSINFEWNKALKYSSSIMLHEFTLIILPMFCTVGFAVIVSNIVYNRGVPFSFDPVKPQFNRLNPVQGFKNIFGKKGMVGAAQSIVRLALWMGGVAVIIRLMVPDLINLPLCGEGCVSPMGLSLATQLVTYACLILLAVALFDMPIQKALFLMDQKMGHSEKKREDKDVYGSPEIKAARREFQREISSNAGAPSKERDATIIIIGKRNAIAVHYDSGSEKGPSVVSNARGKDILRFVEKAKEDGVPTFTDDGLAEGLAATPAGFTIMPKHYTRLAVAMVKCGISL